MDADQITRQFLESVRRLMAAQTPKWTQRDLAKALKVTDATISRMMSGKWAPSVATIASVCEVFGVELCELLCPKPRKKK